MTASRSGWQQSLQIIFTGAVVMVLVAATAPFSQRNAQFCQGSRIKPVLELCTTKMNQDWIKLNSLPVKLYILFLRVWIVLVIQFLKSLSRASISWWLLLLAPTKKSRISEEYWALKLKANDLLTSKIDLFGQISKFQVDTTCLNSHL